MLATLDLERLTNEAEHLQPLLTTSYDGSSELATINLEDRELPALTRQRLRSYGFAIIQSSGIEDPREVIEDVADKLGLGERFMPRQYHIDYEPYERMYSDGINLISPDDTIAHPTFSSSSAQPAHVDGTQEPIGSTNTVLMYTETPAPTGGHNGVFNAVRAFRTLVRSDPELAQVLLSENTLYSQSNEAGISSMHPAFAFQKDGKLVTKYSEDPRTSWRRDAPTDAARQRLRDMQGPDSDMVTNIASQAGRLLVIHNTVVSHSRTAFEVDANQPKRRVHRALYRRAAA